MDIEGAELAAIEGGRHFIEENCHMKIVMKWSPLTHKSARQEKANFIWDFLFYEIGYHVFRVVPENYLGIGSPTQLEELSRDSVWNIPHSDLFLQPQDL
ncbi:MAG: FkbM family methyltransferase [Limnothrix sp. RL_2_0]|nr:FkbM family methyltransferase [Limnothrix sp. RL_2_0]